MDCTQVERDGLIERYLSWKSLGPEDAVPFELHYFECDVCFENLEIARAIRAVVLDSGAPSARAERAAPIGGGSWRKTSISARMK